MHLRHTLTSYHSATALRALVTVSNSTVAELAADTPTIHLTAPLRTSTCTRRRPPAARVSSSAPKCIPVSIWIPLCRRRHLHPYILLCSVPLRHFQHFSSVHIMITNLLSYLVYQRQSASYLQAGLPLFWVFITGYCCWYWGFPWVYGWV